MNSVRQAASMGSRFKVGEAPIFRPTAEEFDNPLTYIASIREQAEPYGVCKVGVLGAMAL